MDPTPFIDIVSSDQQPDADEDEDELPPFPEETFNPWPRPSEYIVMGGGIAVAFGLLGLLTMMIKARAPVAPNPFNPNLLPPIPGP